MIDYATGLFVVIAAVAVVAATVGLAGMALLLMARCTSVGRPGVPR